MITFSNQTWQQHANQCLFSHVCMHLSHVLYIQSQKYRDPSVCNNMKRMKTYDVATHLGTDMYWYLLLIVFYSLCPGSPKVFDFDVLAYVTTFFIQSSFLRLHIIVNFIWNEHSMGLHSWPWLPFSCILHISKVIKASHSLWNLNVL